MGSSAGGHLAALLSTYYKELEFENIDEIDKSPAVPISSSDDEDEEFEDTDEEFEEDLEMEEEFEEGADL